MNAQRETKVSAIEAPPLTDGRTERMWEGVLAREHRRRLRGRVAGALVLALGIYLLTVRPRTDAPISPAPEVRAEAPKDVVLPDGSRFEVATGGRLIHDLQAQNFRLEGGSVHAVVQKHPSQNIEMTTPLASLRTSGATFDLSYVAAPAAMRVTVADGTVLVRTERTEVALGPGDRWEWDRNSVSAPPATPPSTPSARASAAPPKVADAERLFARADAARLGGRVAEAAHLFDEQRRRFPNAENSGVAAFEAGRLYLRVGEPQRAAVALRFAISKDDPSFREDAVANLVEALSQLSDAPACQAARTSYLAAYPEGAHRARVTRYCP